MNEPHKTAFLKTWPGGYKENFEVYEQATGGKEAEIVAKCLVPFFMVPFSSFGGKALEIGCGKGFWVNKYLLNGFTYVIGLDVIPREWVEVDNPRFTYIEVPDRNYECHGVSNASVDFVWSFGCFCHLPLQAIKRYLASIMRVLKPGGRAVLFFSNTDRRVGTGTPEDAPFNPSTEIIWCINNWDTTRRFMEYAGFKNVTDLMPDHKDTMAYGEKAQ